MGQYFLIANLDKKEFIHPHTFRDGEKLTEFMVGGAVMSGLAALLASGNGRGRGDIESTSPIIGSWSGDRVVILGDYVKASEVGMGESGNAYQIVKEQFTDIGQALIAALNQDRFLRNELGLKEHSK